MNAFMSRTMADIRGGRQSWRVVSVFSFASLAIAVMNVVIGRGF
ncbi:MAG: hypothetical protein JWO97_4748 [Acidobacteria bacterium]|nr:hypothetical protein [Acidobacteriota bacterium]